MVVRICAAGVAIAMCVVSACILSARAEDNGAGVPQGELSDKILLVYISTEPTYPNFIIEDARFSEEGKRMFLTGKGADTRRKEDWRTGLETKVGWEAVTTFHVLTRDEYKAFLDGADAWPRE